MSAEGLAPLHTGFKVWLLLTRVKFIRLFTLETACTSLTTKVPTAFRFHRPSCGVPVWLNVRSKLVENKINFLLHNSIIITIITKISSHCSGVVLDLKILHCSMT